MQAVEVEAVKPDTVISRKLKIVLSQPFDELKYLPIGPHPGRESAERYFFGWSDPSVANEVIDLCSIGPVCFDRQKLETFFLNQLARNSGTHVIKLGRAVARFAKQHKPAITNSVHQPIKVAGFNGRQRLRF